MNTITQQQEKNKSRKNKRPLYGYAPWFFGFGLLIILAGFYNSFLMRFGSNDHKHQFHGVASLLWMGLLIVQPVLTTRGTIRWHRVLGKSPI